MANRRPLIVNPSAGQIQEITDSDGLVGNGTIPVGGIIMWSGTIANIPTGWALCNGSNSTPDLRNRFVVAAASDSGTGVTFNANSGATSGDYAPGNTGGSVAHQLTEDEMPSHNHSYSQSTDGNNFGGDGQDVHQNYTSSSTGSAGADDFHENRPPYYALAFIMRTV